MKLLLGDCLDKLKELEDNSVDSIVTDPPYGLAFMGKKWDYDVPSQAIWEECLRVLKPGGHILSFAGSRTYHRMAVRIEDAGFEIRDQIMWIYGSGFPKSHNIGKAIDKIEGNEREVVGENPNKKGRKSDGKGSFVSDTLLGKGENAGVYVDKGNSQWEGWGTALKPAHEPIVMARKPLIGTVADNVLEYGVGGLNIDGCRIGYTDDYDKKHQEDIRKGTGTFFGGNGTSKSEQVDMNGRFPANIIFECTCEKVIEGDKGEIKYSSGSRDNVNLTHEWGYNDIQRTNYTDTGNIHTDPNCPCYILDQQSGNKKSTKRGAHNNKKTEYTNTYTPSNALYSDDNTYGDEGGASRFFYCPKASKKDRNEGCDELEEKQRPGQTGKGNYSSSVYCKDCGKTHNGTNDHSECNDDVEYRPSTTTTKNNHPTVKPTELMKYLIRLVTPKGGVVLDPFMGSGSTGKAAVLEGMEFIGIEREEEYYEIAKQRIQNETNKRKFW
jgi:site-specific DNA-methyltransferase (adenine-specific)